LAGAQGQRAAVHQHDRCGAQDRRGLAARAMRRGHKLGRSAVLDLDGDGAVAVRLQALDRIRPGHPPCPWHCCYRSISAAPGRTTYLRPPDMSPRSGQRNPTRAKLRPEAVPARDG
jgi:hypothetical protein